MADILDQSNYSGSLGVGFGDTGNGRDYMCMGFIPTLANIDAVSFSINSKPGAGLGYKVWIDNADSNFYPTGAVGVGIGGATEIPSASLVTGALTKYSLASQVTLIPGNRYVLCFAPWDLSSHTWAQSYNDWLTSVSNPYANGRRVHGNASFASWSAPDSGNSDLVFETYAGPTLVSPFPSSIR